jgi:predicted DNA-binding transcriptional regulator YafY
MARPTQIAKDPWAVRALLDAACEEFWLVRLSYVDSQGRSSELTVEPTDVEGDRLYANCFPRGNQRTFVIDVVEWARVLTEAEEDQLA